MKFGRSPSSTDFLWFSSKDLHRKQKEDEPRLWTDNIHALKKNSSSSKAGKNSSVFKVKRVVWRMCEQQTPIMRTEVLLRSDFNMKIKGKPSSGVSINRSKI